MIVFMSISCPANSFLEIILEEGHFERDARKKKTDQLVICKYSLLTNLSLMICCV